MGLTWRSLRESLSAKASVRQPRLADTLAANCETEGAATTVDACQRSPAELPSSCLSPATAIGHERSIGFISRLPGQGWFPTFERLGRPGAFDSSATSGACS